MIRSSTLRVVISGARWGFGAANQSRPYARKKARAFNIEQRDRLVYHNHQVPQVPLWWRAQLYR